MLNPLPNVSASPCTIVFHVATFHQQWIWCLHVHTSRLKLKCLALCSFPTRCYSTQTHTHKRNVFFLSCCLPSKVFECSKNDIPKEKSKNCDMPRIFSDPHTTLPMHLGRKQNVTNTAAPASVTPGKNTMSRGLYEGLAIFETQLQTELCSLVLMLSSKFKYKFVSHK